MYLRKSRLTENLVRNVLLALLFVLIFASLCAAAETQSRLGALEAANAQRQASAQAADNIIPGGPGSDLRTVATPRQQTFTGFPAGTLTLTNNTGGSDVPLSRIAVSGEPLAPAIGLEMVGTKLDRLSVIAAHLGYTIVRIGYSPTVMDTPYSYALMSGSRKISTLYFNRSMALTMVQ